MTFINRLFKIEKKNHSPEINFNKKKKKQMYRNIETHAAPYKVNKEYSYNFCLYDKYNVKTQIDK